MPPSTHLHHPVRRLRQFLHPSGRIVHVAPSPEHVEALRKELSSVHGPEGENFDLYIQGSEEHVKAVNEAREYHETRRRELQEAHTDVFEQFEQIHRDLNVLSSELGAITEKEVSLDANFGRFGYSAHISESP